LREMVHLPSQNTVGICNQITLLILYYASSRLVILLKAIDAIMQVSDIFDLTVSFKFTNFSFFRYSCFLFLKCLSASGFTLFRLSTLLWFWSCNHCTLAYFLWSKNREHSSSNYGLFCFSSYRHRQSLVEVLIFSVFSHALFMFLLSLISAKL
jgi:hypothetical protein